MQSTTQIIRWNPENYSVSSLTQFQHARVLIEKYAFSGTEKILDIGCGDGKITAALSQCVPEGSVLGIDQASEMIEFARKNFSGTGFANVNFKVENAVELEYKNQFDLIVSFSCLHYIKNDNQLRVLKNIRRALKPNGKILLMLYRKCPEQWAAIDEVANRCRWQPYFRDFTPDYYEYLPDMYQTLLQQAELAHFTASFTELEYLHYESEAEVATFMKGWLPHVSRIPPPWQDEFMNEVAAAYLRNLGICPGDPIDTPFVRLLVC